jgi:hypothetical protein
MKTVVSWLLEPLGLIPTVGSLVRGGVQTFINVGLDSTIQAAELKLKEAEKPEEVETIGDSFGANVFEGLVEYVQDALKAAPKELVELFKDGKEPADLAAAAAELIGGAALKAILARVVKPAQTVSKEDVTGLMDGLKDVQKQMVDQMLRTPGGEAPIGFDELAARMTSTTHLDGIAIDVPDVAYVATPPDGASVVLIGGQNAGHTPSNLLFVKGLIDRGLGYEGTFVKRKHSITHPHGQLEFNFPGDVEEIVTTYIEQYGSGSGRITKKDLKFV